MVDNGGRRGRGVNGSSETDVQISFVAEGTGFRGAGVTGRCWCITPAVTGWRLEFRDPGDDEPTYAGMFGTAERAMQEASRDSSRPRLRRG